jgi:hypothetical protein
MSVFFSWFYAAWIIPGVGCVVELVSWRFSGCCPWLVTVIALLMISGGWIFALDRW